MKIGILECGAPPKALRARFGGYGGMVQRMLGPAREADIFDVPSGELPSDASCDAYVLTGSPAGVYDDLPWIPPLLAFLRQSRGRARFVGICFGHQAMAVAFGGSAEKSAKGWGVGLHRYAVAHRAPWMDDAPHVDVAATHQDQVTSCPPGARVVAASDFAPYAALDYGDAISFQFHPEFTPDFATALIETLRDRFGDLSDPAIASHAQPNDCARVRRWVERFLDGPGD
ncbi:MAG TPA: type 1 glutamine amidotransferase [Acidisphaera sp.]|nr:type 1 glutamine amidotransferase [Acidisphaera sp.]